MTGGTGKLTLLKILSRSTELTAVQLYGRIVSLLEIGTGFHPELSGQENIFLNDAILSERTSRTCASGRTVARVATRRSCRVANRVYSFSTKKRYPRKHAKRHEKSCTSFVPFRVFSWMAFLLLVKALLLNRRMNRSCVAKMCP